MNAVYCVNVKDGINLGEILYELVLEKIMFIVA